MRTTLDMLNHLKTYADFMGDSCRDNHLYEKICEEIEILEKEASDREHVLNFGKWLDNDAIRAGDDMWTYRGDGFKLKRTTDDMYNLYLKIEEEKNVKTEKK